MTTTQTTTHVKTIDVNCLEWLDKVNGNSYFAGSVTVNYKMPDEKTYYLPFQYGYGSQYEEAAKAELIKRGLLDKEKIGYYGLPRYSRENGIIYRGRLVDKCKKAELTGFTKLAEQEAKKEPQTIS